MTSKSDLKLQQIISALKTEFDPSRLFLFGSRATETHRADSDYDLVMVVPELKNRHSAEIKARSMILNSVGVSADIFIYNEKDFEAWKDELSSIPETALNTGTEIDLG